MSIRRLVVIGLATAGLVAGSATAAFAGGVPTPTPQFGGHVRVHPVNWQFDLEQAQIGLHNLALVEGSGAIPMTDWTDTQLTPNVDKFSLGPNSVTLWHDALPVPRIDLKTCTVLFDQNGRFRVLNGTGTGAGFQSVNGTFELQALFSFAERARSGHYGHSSAVCPLPANPFLVRHLILIGSGLPAPVFSNVSVQGEALLFRVLQLPKVFAPTASPSDYVTPSATDTTTAP